MPLEEYRARHDLTKSREPSGAAKAKSHKLPIFVVQEHHAATLRSETEFRPVGPLLRTP
jgi:hypothetical protein